MKTRGNAIKIRATHMLQIKPVLFVLFFTILLMMAGTASADTAGPSITLYPANGSQVFYTELWSNFNGSAWDPDGVDVSSAVTTLDGVTVSNIWWHPDDEETGEINPYSAYWSSTKLNVSRGIHVLKVTLKDNLGNVTTVQSTFEVVDDTVPPVISNQTPPNGLATSNTKPLIMAILSDNVGIRSSSVVMKVDGQTVPFTLEHNSVKYTPTTALAYGVHAVYVYVEDMNGNGVSSTWSFTVVDTTVGPSEPSIISASPGANDVVKGRITESSPFGGGVTLFFVVTDPDGLKEPETSGSIISSSNQIKVDGKLLPTYFNYPEGYWESDSESQWWIVTSKNKAEIAAFTVLNEGPHIVELTATDSLGNRMVQAWTFHVAGIRAIPEKNATISDRQPNMQVTVFAKDLVKNNVRFYIDDVPVAFNFIPDIVSANTGTVIYTPAEPLANEKTHNVKLSVTDINGTTDYTWYYYVNAWGGSSNIAWDTLPVGKTCQQCHRAKTTLADYLINSSYYPYADRKKYYQNFISLASFEKAVMDTGNKRGQQDDWVSRSLEFNEIHKLYKKDVYGNNWIDVNTCKTCHINHYNNYSMTTIENCTTGMCHDASDSLLPLNYSPILYHTWAGAKCDVCHGTPYQPPKTNYPRSDYYKYRPIPGSSKLGHDIGKQHLGSIDFGDCSSCHSKYLWREHERYTVNGVRLNCDTCHKSTNAAVQNAITNNQTECSSCHASGDHEAVHNFGLDANCKTCHKSSLSQEHLANSTTQGKNFGCNTCHGSTGKGVVRTIAAERLYCAGCHTQGHNVLFADIVPGDIPLYTGFSWSTPMEASLYAGEPTLPTGYDTGQVVISNRRSDILCSQVWNFYNGQLTANGWTINSAVPAEGAQSFAVEYKKYNRFVTVKCFNTELSDGTGAAVNSGFRIEIWYK